MSARYLSSLLGLNSSNAQNYYFATAGYTCSQVLTGGASATTVTIPTGYRGVSMSAQGSLYYVNISTTATGSGSTTTNGTADLECPASLVLYDETNTLLTTISLYAPVTCTVFLRYFR